MEGYHVMATHPQLQKAAPRLYNGMYLGDRVFPIKTADPAKTLKENVADTIHSLELMSVGMAGMIHAKEIEIAKSLADVDKLGITFPDDPNDALMYWMGILQDGISKGLQERGEPVPDLNVVCQTDPVHALEFLFPHYFLLPTFTSMSAYRIRPLGPETCFFELWSLTMFPEGEEPEPIMEPVILPYDSPEFPEIPRQDYANIPLQQKGLHTRGFEYMRLSKEVEGLISNYQRIIDGYLAGRSTSDLAKATQLLGGNFDGPIKDLGI